MLPLMKAILNKTLTLSLLIVLLLSSRVLTAAEAPLEPQPPVQSTPAVGEDLGYGVGSVLASVIYSPLKITYAALGLITGGLGYVLSAGSPDVANSIIYPAVGGNYVITPNHLRGVEPVIFIGPPAPNQFQTQMASPALPPPQP